MQRRSRRIDGYDHILLPCGVNGCGTVPSGSHGRHGEEWFYAVAADDNLTAISLQVYTSRMPPQVLADPTLRARWPGEAFARYERGMPAAIAMHAAPSLAGGEVDYDDCFALGGPCRIVGSTYTLGETLWAVNGSRVAPSAPDLNAELGCTPDYFEQGERFWEALERLFVEWDERARDGRMR